ncbi:unnamed protein product [Darwinula stevensoni]|uniref:Choline transporter-like protein n=1 Tax=Darwinula stevensoni TaxID=69355 RepID=A0A7R8WY75_9CRUS|nr:unnamed protein product [Darwinula stevensoni]CAG0879033.1 unnamed protein product [Darwinula stevensoni]
MEGCCGKVSSPEERRPKPWTVDRKCTDLPCLVVFIVFLFILIFISAFALVYGNPLRLVNGYDSFGNTCGTTNEILGNLSYSGMDMTDHPYVFYFDMTDLYHSLRICVKECPGERLDSLQDILSFYNETGSLLCRYDYNSYYVHPDSSLNITIPLTSPLGPCPPPPIYASSPVLNRCVPKRAQGVSADIIYNLYGYLNSIHPLQQIISDLYSSWREILGLVFFSVGEPCPSNLYTIIVISFIMVYLIYVLTALVAWIFMATVSIAAIVLTSLLWWTYGSIKAELDITPPVEILVEMAENETAFLTLAILSTIATVILVLVMIVLRRRVALVVHLFWEASACLRDVPLLFIQPLWTFLTLLLFFLYWTAVMIALSTANHAQKEDVMREIHNAPSNLSHSILRTMDSGETSVLDEATALQKEFSLMKFVDPLWIQYFWWFHVLALIWISEFILACQQMVIAGTVAQWYFYRDKGGVRCMVCRATRRLVVYHLGSVALGSFVITLFKLPRLFLAWLKRQLKKQEGLCIVEWALKCCHGCFYCLEKFIKYLNHNAYTVIALEGVDFCPAARTAFGTLASNALQVAAINSVGDFILFLGKVTVTAVTGLVALLIMKGDSQLHYYAVPLVVTCLFAYFIAHCVFSVYEMVIDTLFLCFCEDYNTNDGTDGREFHSPQTLFRFMTIDAPDSLQQERHNHNTKSPGNRETRRLDPSVM